MAVTQSLGPLPQGGRTKPDPDEPYRYVCPGCHKQVHRNHRAMVYRCQHCGTSYDLDQLYDQKKDRVVADYTNDNTVPK